MTNLIETRAVAGLARILKHAVLALAAVLALGLAMAGVSGLLTGDVDQQEKWAAVAALRDAPQVNPRPGQENGSQARLDAGKGGVR